MLKRFCQSHLLTCCCLASIAAHVALADLASLFASYRFGRAVKDPAVVTVEFAQGAAPPAASGRAEQPPGSEKPAPAGGGSPSAKESAAESPAPPAAATPLQKEGANPEPEGEPEKTAGEESRPEAAPVPTAPLPPARPGEQEPVAPAVAASDRESPAKGASNPAAAPSAASAQNAVAVLSGALSGKYEKLSYQISMHGIPVGSAVLEAKNEQGMTSITLRVRSSAAMSAIYPVDDLIETRHVAGRYLMTRIRQKEGSFKSDETFTINTRIKRVSWADFATPRTAEIAVASADVMDSLSGIYYLRNLPLQVGNTETLHIFDSQTYADVPVEIVRREELRLPNLEKVSALVVRPLQKTAGMFRRTGEVLIWMSDDDKKVPLKVETSIPLGKVTARLVAAESAPQGMQ